MSGIVGIVHFDGSPVESELLRKLADFLVFRGPDAQQTWIKDNVGFAHTLFKTTEESDRDSQPLTLDGKTWIVADARIDARDELFVALKAAGEIDTAPSGWTDAELILSAYRAWGLDCVEHLLGDFAFGIWDDTRQRLFCARDHMGVKPFYYAQFGSCVIFSNTLECIRRDPRISDKLNDLAIADFLLFGFNQESATTSFAEIQRIPRAHTLTWSADGLSVRRYWSMPVDEPIFYKQADDYIDHCHDLLRRCVADRLRTRQVWVFMSGGLDSPTLAATARDLMQARYSNFDLRALTKIDSFAPSEARYAGATANFLGIPIIYRSWTEDADLRWEQIPFSTPEPSPSAWMVPGENKFWHGIGRYSRVFFYGEGPDNALRCEWKRHFAYLLRRNYSQLVSSAIATLFAEKYPPFWGRISKKFKRGRYLAKEGEPVYPEWLNASFEARLGLGIRWNSLNTSPVGLHPYRPTGYMSLQIPLWQTMFEGLDSGVTKSSFEVRHPYVDIRMLRFLLAVPSLPWCRSKYLLRRAMHGKLPEEVLCRRKAIEDQRPLESFWAMFCQYPFVPAPQIHEYVDTARLPSRPLPGDIESEIRMRSLNHWLQNSHRSSHNPLEAGVCDRSSR
jgi:asparagine synthase (glutamine-hydrolysing)